MKTRTTTASSEPTHATAMAWLHKKIPVNKDEEGTLEMVVWKWVKMKRLKAIYRFSYRYQVEKTERSLKHLQTHASIDHHEGRLWVHEPEAFHFSRTVNCPTCKGFGVTGGGKRERAQGIGTPCTKCEAHGQRGLMNLCYCGHFNPLTHSYCGNCGKRVNLLK